MMKKLEIFRRIAALFLCVLLLPITSAFAEVSSEDYVIIDPDELESRIQAYIDENGINPDRISVGFCYTATGDTWIYNPDRWYYAASMYKVPMMMTLAEKVAAGEMTQDYVIAGKTLADIEDTVLVYSNNEWAHVIREQYYHSDSEWREIVKKYSTMDESEYSEDFVGAFYVNTRYMLDVFKTLYASPETYPNIIDCLLQANPGEYLKKYLGDTYNIAQKYGSYEANGEWFINTTGIIYTPNPIIVTVLTNTISSQETVIGSIGKILTDYTLELDTNLDAELERRAAEEAAAAAEAERQAEEAKKAEEDALKAKQAQQAAQQTEAEKAVQEAQHKAESKKLTISAVAAIIAVAGLLLALKASRRKKEEQARREAYLKKKRYEEFERRYQAEMAAEREHAPTRRDNNYK